MSSTLPPEASTAPAAPAEPDHGLTLVLPGRRSGFGAGAGWIGDGWRLFTRAPLMWVLSIVGLFVVAIAMGLVPLVGSLAFQLLQAVIAGGFVLACRSLETGGEFEIDHLLAGFRMHFGSLLAVGAIFVVASLAVLLVFALFAGFSLLGAILAGSTESAMAAVAAGSLTLALGGLVALALWVPIMAAYWFAPALVIMHGLSPVQAMKESLMACLRNILPFLLYGILMTVLAIVAAIPFGLGFLVWVPVAIASTYAAYRDIFTEDTREQSTVVVA